MSNQSNVARNAVWLVAQPVLVGVVSIVVTALVARDLGAADYGTLLLLLSYTALFTQISNLGLRPYSVREIAADSSRTAEIVSEMIVLRSALAGIAILVAALLLALIDPALPVPLAVALFVLILLNALTGCFIDGLQGGEHMKAVATSFAISGVLVQVSSLASIALHLGVTGIAAAYVLGAIAMLTLVWSRFHLLAGKVDARYFGKPRILHLRLSWVFLLQNIVGTIRARIDLVIINAMFGAHAAGIYGSAMVLIQRLDQIQDGIATALFSRVAYLNARFPDELKTLVRGAVKVILVISTPMAVGLLAVSNDVVALMFGNQYGESGPILAILGLGVPFMFVSGVMFNVLRAMSVEAVVLKASLCTTLLMIFFFIAGIYLLGLAGAAWAYVLGVATLATLLLLEYRRIAGAPWSGADLVKIVAANAAMAGVLWLIRDQAMVMKVIAAIVVYATVVRVLGLVTVGMIKTMFVSRKSTS